MEAERMLMAKRGNLQKDLSAIGEKSGEGTEIQAITLFKLMKAFERVIQKVYERQNKPVHTVMQYDYTIKQSREFLYHLARTEKTCPFERIFEVCENRIQAIFHFLSLLELVQMKYLSIITGEGRNNFLIEFNGEGDESLDEGLLISEW
jgi:segregation and condensation protein A